jgi:F-type H+-transporting ATPase subunit a
MHFVFEFKKIQKRTFLYCPKRTLSYCCDNEIIILDLILFKQYNAVEAHNIFMPTLAPETIFYIGNFPVTNTILNTILVDLIIIGSILYINKKITKMVPGTFQNIIEMLVKGFQDFTQDIAGKNTNKILPFFLTFFIFIIIANWLGLILGHGLINYIEHDGTEVSLFRSAATDMNFALALAIVSVIATHTLSITTIGIKKYLSHFFNSFNPLYIFVGIIDIISEIIKLISFSFRLFGNIFAGEIILSIIGLVTVFVLPVPFLVFEIFVALLQSAVFALLTMIFMAMLMMPKHEEK